MAGHKELNITASFGVAQCGDETPTAESLVDLADQALLCAKHSGRDRVVCSEMLCQAEQLDLTSPEQYGGLFQGMFAEHVMSPVVACICCDEAVAAAADYFIRSRISSTPVVDRQGKLVGMLSEKDLLAAMVSPRSWQSPVRQVMQAHVISYEEDTPVRTIYEFLCRVSIRRVVILKDGRPTGTISRGTLLRWFRNLVMSHGKAGAGDASLSPTTLDAQRFRDRLAEIAHELARQATLLEGRFQEEEQAGDLVPYVVGGATQMQDLVNNLLAFSRFAAPLGDSAGGLHQAVAVGDGCLD